LKFIRNNVVALGVLLVQRTPNVGQPYDQIRVHEKVCVPFDFKRKDGPVREPQITQPFKIHPEFLQPEICMFGIDSFEKSFAGCAGQEEVPVA